MTRWQKIQAGKIDLDTVGCAFVLGANREIPLEILPSGVAPVSDLANPAILCLEVGGAGQVALSNYDHHEKGGPVESATCQAFQQEMLLEYPSARKLYGEARLDVTLPTMRKLVDYIDIIDTVGTAGLRKLQTGAQFPYLSEVFSGLLILEQDSAEKFYKGIELIDEIVRSGQDPTKTIAGYSAYADAKREMSHRVYEATKSAGWTTTRCGRKLAFLETDAYGAPGALYGQGAEIVVAYSPQFGTPPVPKFTISTKSTQIDNVLPVLNQLEPGWGGPATGTILGSPRLGSKLSLQQVVDLVRQSL